MPGPVSVTESRTMLRGLRRRIRSDTEPSGRLYLIALDRGGSTCTCFKSLLVAQHVEVVVATARENRHA